MFEPSGIKSKNSFLSNDAVDGLILLSILGFILSQFRLSLLFSPTHANGGDTASHFYTLLYLREHLLPHGRISWWTQANLAGFPMLQNYFPLPFLCMALLSTVLPLTVAFKIGTILGVLLLPLGAYAGARAMDLEFPAPILAALSTVPFLFMEANSMWGGNIPSTLAGEFAYGLGMALTLTWMGTLYHGISGRRWIPFNAVLLALIGLCHGYALIFAGTTSLFFLMEKRRFSNNLVYLVEMHTCSFLLLGFWLIPLLAGTPWTTAFDVVWWISSWKEIVPKILWPSILLGLAALAWTPRRPLLYLLFAESLGWIFYLIGTKLGLVDIRFLPFSQVLWGWLAAMGLTVLTRPMQGRKLLPFVVLLIVFAWCGKNTSYIKNWIQWNYSGFEAKPMWPVFSRINELVKGSVQDPRVLYEHSARNEALGTVRAWESLPVFSGRSTLEHAYLQASVSAPFVFYIQSEVSKENSCPFPDYACTTLDPASAVKHLKMFNIKEFIVISQEVKDWLKRLPDYHFKAAAGPYEIYEVAGPYHYVEPLTYQPVLWKGGHWKQTSYLWFRNNNLNDVPLVFPVNLRPEEEARFALQSQDLAHLPREKMPPVSAVRWEKLTDDEVSFETEAIGRPHLIKVSYHPGWKVEGAEKIYLVSPSFMLVFPTQSHVRLYYARRWADHVGVALTLMGILWLAVSWRRRGGKALNPISWMERPIFWRASILFFTVFGIYLAGASYYARKNNVPALMDRGVKYRDQKNWDAAQKCFEKLIASGPLSGPAEHAHYYLATIQFLQQRWEPAIFEFEQLIQLYPHSRYQAEAYFHLAVCNDYLGRQAEKEKAIAILFRDFPQSPWAQYARQRWPRSS